MKTYKVTLSVVRIVSANNEQEAIESAKFNYDEWCEDGVRHIWDKAKAKELKVGEISVTRN
ncbi:MAG: hypothetical protein J6V44_08790 [Methanobrevibacter sp.]|nr:hypothetical protein [Methanobrevibacter sp.]